MMTKLISDRLEMRLKFFYRYLLSMEQKLKEKNLFFIVIITLSIWKTRQRRI